MPLPLGHTAIGLATYDLFSKNQSVQNKFIFAVFVAILANLPDSDRTHFQRKRKCYPRWANL